MRYTQTGLAGAVVVEPEPREDERGFFTRTFDQVEFEANGLDPHVEQCNLSFNHRAGTIRGMHLQIAPAYEAKLVRCSRGAVLDIIVDMRADSATYLQHVAVELSAENRRALYVPPLFAHGYQTLVDGTETVYQVSGKYSPEHERGRRYDDPALGLSWPLPVSVVSAKDQAWPLLDPELTGERA